MCPQDVNVHCGMKVSKSIRNTPPLPYPVQQGCIEIIIKRKKIKLILIHSGFRRHNEGNMMTKELH